MTMLWSLLFSILLGHSYSTDADDVTSIKFKEITIEEAVKIAKRKGKYVFVDTYADWCLPCKQMELVFVDEDVSTFFNTNFVNVRIDMDEPIGKEVADKYDIVFLPTLLILNEDGVVKSKIDRLVKGNELINSAIEAMNSRQIYVDETLSADPFGKKAAKEEKPKEDVQAKIVTEDDAPVIYVHDERASSGRPHIMYHEAYLHLQLMDGKANAVAKKYLSTQSDWSSDKNMKFIFDFLHDVRSKEFQYFVANRARFESMFGEQNVLMTMDVLTNQHLKNGYPRPTYAEVLNLYSHINPNTAKQRADEYWRSRENGENN